MNYYILTNKGLRPTTRRKALLHAGRTGAWFNDIGSTVVAARGTDFKERALEIYHRCGSRRDIGPTMTTAQQKVYLYSRLHARKLKIGIEAIKKHFKPRPINQTTYRIINTRKSKWLIECMVGIDFMDKEPIRYAKTKFLVARRQDRSVWVYEAPASINNCLDAIKHYRSRFPISSVDRRQVEDRRWTH